MLKQTTYQDTRPTLTLVPTPIGNLADITARAITTLKEADIVFAEDTRHTGSLFRHFSIDTPLESLHEHNERAKTARVIEALTKGLACALVSDAGTPLLSDPGADVVRAVIDAGYAVSALPGPSAAITALVASGLPVEPHVFYGFLPSKAGARAKALSTLREMPYTMVFYEAPHRIQATIDAMKDAFGNRRLVIARELSKRYETYVRTTLYEATALDGLKGEIVVLVEGAAENDEALEGTDVVAHIQLLIADGHSEMDAIKRAAKSRKISKNDAYMAYHTAKKDLERKE